MFALDFINTLAFGGLVLFGGYGIRRLVPWLARYSVPAPVIGGLLVAGVLTVARSRGIDLVTFDTRLQTPLMVAFFTTVGFGASLSLLKVGGPQVLVFSLLCAVLAVFQNVIGALLAKPLGMHPLFGVLNGSVTLTGGPATGPAFADAFESAGVPGAATVAVAAAMVGITSGGLMGGPLGTLLVERYRLRRPRTRRAREPLVATAIVEAQLHEPPEVSEPAGEDKESYALLKALVLILAAMWLGSWVSARFAAVGSASGPYFRSWGGTTTRRSWAPACAASCSGPWRTPWPTWKRSSIGTDQRPARFSSSRWSGPSSSISSTRSSSPRV
jgi:ESS family glutamate:Na+ symporter